MNTILAAGGAGYIGSHTVVALQASGYQVVILDNLCNSKLVAINSIQKISSQAPIFYQGDIRDQALLSKIFNNHSILGVIHFAGLKAACESQNEPLKYYDNNVTGSITLLEEMLKAKVDTFVFSSSATVYGQQGAMQYQEDMLTAPIHVYGRTKLMVEEILKDSAKANTALKVACLRYFNPVGAHSSGLIGENPTETPQ